MVKLWKQPRYPSADECIKKMQYLHRMEFCLVTKKNDILSFASKWMELENVFFFAVLGLELRAYTLSHSTSPFLVVVFSRQGLANYLLGWLRNTILVISAS
jgi:hypothetical protein